jgi:hypothetical protein
MSSREKKVLIHEGGILVGKISHILWILTQRMDQRIEGWGRLKAFLLNEWIPVCRVKI